MIIHSVDQGINYLNQSESFFKREIVSRVCSIASTILFPVEAVLRTAFAALTFTAYVIVEPFKLARNAYRLANDANYKAENFADDERRFLNKLVIDPIFKAITSIAVIPVNPFVAFLSAKAAVQMHVDCRLTTFEKPQKTEPAAHIAYLEKRPELQVTLEKEIHDKFLSYYSDPQKIYQCLKNKIPLPSKLYLHGPSRIQNKRSAEYVALYFNKTLHDFNPNDTASYKKLDGNTQALFWDLTKYPMEGCTELASLFESKGFLVILSNDNPPPKDDLIIQVNIPLPGPGARERVIKKQVDLDEADLVRLRRATDGMPVEKIEKSINKAKQKAFHKNAAVTADNLLEEINAVKDSKKKNKGLLNPQLQKELHESFISCHTSQQKIDEMKQYNLTTPTSLYLYGSSMAENRKVAEYTAKKLGKKLLHISKAEDYSKLELNSSVIYYNAKEHSGEGLKEIVKLAERKKLFLILANNTPFTDIGEAGVQINVGLPDATHRNNIIAEGLNNIAELHEIDRVQLGTAVEGLKVKKIERILERIRKTALQTRNPVTTATALEIAKTVKSSMPVAQTEVKAADDFVGMEELHKKFDKYIRVLKDPKKAAEWGRKLPAGMILHGAPGCGKTYTAKHLASYAKSKGVEMNFFEMKGSDVATKWKGEGMLKIRSMFELAKKNAPAILFIDECEGLLPSREHLGDALQQERTQELDEILQLIEQAKLHNVIVIGATNHLHKIDSAILRTGRFDYTFEVKPPDAATRQKMFAAKLAKTKHDSAIDLAQISALTEGFTASDIDTIVNDAAGESWEHERPIDQAMLIDSINVIKKKRESVSSDTPEKSSKGPSGLMRDLKRGLDAVRDLMKELDHSKTELAGTPMSATPSTATISADD